MIYGHGDDIYTINDGSVLNFSSNVYAESTNFALYSHIINSIPKISSYPEPDASSFVQSIANKYNIPRKNIVATNGAVDAIYLVALLFSGKNSTILIPTFREYQDACLVHKHNVRFVTDIKAINNSTDLVWICNPCNPTGQVISKKDIQNLVNRYPSTYFVLDHSYKFFTNEIIIEDCEALNHDNIIIINSLTKKYSVPGLRIGYLNASEKIINSLKKIMQPWAVNSLAIEAGIFLNSMTAPPFDLDGLLIETKRVMNEIDKIPKIKTIPTSTHFFLCELFNNNAADLKAYLLKKHILIRDASNFEGLGSNYIRIATQTKTANNQLTRILNEWSH